MQIHTVEAAGRKPRCSGALQKPGDFMDLSFPLTAGDGRHLYQQIYEYIREEIRTGRLAAGEKLPATRQLAANLQIARTTAELAYAQLEEEGYIVIRRGSGAYVCEISNIPEVTQEYGRTSRTEPGDGKTENPASGLAESGPAAGGREEEGLIDFSPRTIDMSMFPYATWRRILRGILTGDRSDLFRRGDPKGDRSLRTTIAHYLHLSRGCVCEPEQVIIGAGNDYLLMVLAILLRGDRADEPLQIAMERYTYLRAAQVLQAEGYGIAEVESDAGGLVVRGSGNSLEASGCRLVYTMPARQFPTGAVMPYPRRAELLAWARAQEDRYIIEDDYDSEFKYRGRPVPSLQSTDQNGQVIYIGTFSKSIAPAIRVSYLILPKRLLPDFERHAGFLSCTVPRLDQAVLDEFIRDGYFERYLNRMRNRYKTKHDRMLELLTPLGKCFRITGQGAGLHLVLEQEPREGAAPAQWEQILAERAREQGVLVYPMEEQRLENSGMTGPESRQNTSQPARILLGYAALSEEDMQKGMEGLARAWMSEGGRYE